MTRFLNSNTRKLIEARMKRSGYRTPDDLVVAALASLEQQERFGDFEPGQLEKLLAEGEASGKFLDGPKALATRRRRRAGGKSDSAAKTA
jgi:hypothetical protein